MAKRGGKKHNSNKSVNGNMFNTQTGGAVTAKKETAMTKQTVSTETPSEVVAKTPFFKTKLGKILLAVVVGVAVIGGGTAAYRKYSAKKEANDVDGVDAIDTTATEPAAPTAEDDKPVVPAKTNKNRGGSKAPAKTEDTDTPPPAAEDGPGDGAENPAAE